MKVLLLFLMLFSLITFGQTPTPATDSAPMSITSFKWTRARQKVDAQQSHVSVPERQVTSQNKNFACNARMNEPRVARDSNQDRLDGRSAANRCRPSSARAYKHRTHGSTSIA